MAMSRRRKWCLAIAVTLALLFLILPPLLGLALRGMVEKKIAAHLNAPVRLGSLYVTLISPGMQLIQLEVGKSAPECAGEPMVRIDRLQLGITLGTLFGGDPHVTTLRIKSAEIHLGCDDKKGAATLARFISQLPPSDRKVPLPIDHVSVRECKIFLHVPKQLMAPQSALEPEPVRIDLRRLSVSDLLLPAPGQAAPKDVWTEIVVTGLSVQAPLKDVPAVADPVEAGEPLEEGLFVDKISGQIQIPSSLTAPLQIRSVKVEGLQARNLLRGPLDPETFTRIHAAREFCLKAPPPKPAAQGMTLGNGSIYLEDLSVGNSSLEIQGPDGNGKPCFWRLTDLNVSLAKFGFGPGAGSPTGGHLKISSPSKSSAGDGNILVEWNDVAGNWPKSSFTKKVEVTGVALAPLSARVQKRSNAGVTQGSLSSEFHGTTTDGKLHWDGSVTLSKDTQLNGAGVTAEITSRLARVANGAPIKTIRVRGSLDDPKVEMPDFLAGAALYLAESVLLDAPVSALKMFGSAMESAIDQGVRETEKALKKIPGIGGLFGGGDEKKTGE